MQSVFITGASGCVGHYLVDELARDYQLYLLVRNPRRLRFDPKEKPNVTIVHGDLGEIGEHAELLSRMDYCVHAATAWGGEAAERINVQGSHELFSLLNPGRVKRVVYFSTASILGRGNLVLPEAGIHGTAYIKSKHGCYTKLPESPIHDRIVTVFPTLVFGGDSQHPFSHLTSGLPRLRRYAWLIGRFSIEATFHFIHAEDIARIVRFLLTAPEVGEAYVMGNEPVTFGEFAKRAAAYFGHRVGWQVKLTPGMILRLAKLLRVKLSAWDRFCLEYSDFRYQTVNCPSLGLPSTHSTVEEILADWQLVGD